LLTIQSVDHYSVSTTLCSPILSCPTLSLVHSHPVFSQLCPSYALHSSCPSAHSALLRSPLNLSFRPLCLHSSCPSAYSASPKLSTHPVLPLTLPLLRSPLICRSAYSASTTLSTQPALPPTLPLISSPLILSFRPLCLYYALHSSCPSAHSASTTLPSSVLMLTLPLLRSSVIRPSAHSTSTRLSTNLSFRPLCIYYALHSACPSAHSASTTLSTHPVLLPTLPLLRSPLILNFRQLCLYYALNSSCPSAHSTSATLSTHLLFCLLFLYYALHSACPSACSASTMLSTHPVLPPTLPLLRSPLILSFRPLCLYYTLPSSVLLLTLPLLRSSVIRPSAHSTSTRLCTNPSFCLLCLYHALPHHVCQPFRSSLPCLACCPSSP
jgi:hypothetical protein